ncbi:hypothetical protein J2X54_001647 [Duganella sp. 3397]|uniref:hypothetical protein n=1 Tax=Duganella sp. 3397 TaxID=2817732 RepID=UPI002865F511|nr:hypothetical protein [Duganella sp. 3397]MDR7049199.1 hypothetical protein [Duganella sp. 3397]
MKHLPPADPPASPRRRTPKKITSAATVVAQAQARTGIVSKVQSLSLSRLEYGVDASTGQRTLAAVFPSNKGREPQHLDLSFLLDFRNLCALFADAYLQWGATRAPASRWAMIASLTAGFFHYLNSRWHRDLKPQEVDDELLIGFRTFLLTVKGKGGKTLHARTSAAYLGCVRTLLGAVVVGPSVVLARNIASRVPPGPLGAARRSCPVEVMGLDDLLAIIEAAEREVLATALRFERGRELLAEGNARLEARQNVGPWSIKEYTDLSVCLAALDRAYPGIIPDLPIIQSYDRALGSAVQYVHSQGTVASHFHPSFRHLAPFAVLLAITTVFNPDTLLGLSWKDIAFDKECAGTAAIEIVGAKNRASQDLVRLLDPEAAVASQLSLEQLLRTLQLITARIRPFVPDWHADRIFIAVQTQRAKKPRSYGGGKTDSTLSGDVVWTRSLRNFIDDNKLPNFSLGQLRPSILDLVQLSHGSLEAAQKVGNHRNPRTTWTHYTSNGVKKRYRERIGQVILMRERWIDSQGVVDPRRLESVQDKGAATPGFTCLDPFSSPRPGQQAGKLCRDYGGCPSCPLAAAHPNDPVSVAYYVALEHAVFRSQTAMSSSTWLERWVPVLADLKSLKAHIPLEVMEESRKISITLMNVE